MSRVALEHQSSTASSLPEMPELDEPDEEQLQAEVDLLEALLAPSCKMTVPSTFANRWFIHYIEAFRTSAANGMAMNGPTGVLWAFSL